MAASSSTVAGERRAGPVCVGVTVSRLGAEPGEPHTATDPTTDDATSHRNPSYHAIRTISNSRNSPACWRSVAMMKLNTQWGWQWSSCFYTILLALLTTQWDRRVIALQTPMDAVGAPRERNGRRGNSVQSPWERNGNDNTQWTRSASAEDTPRQRGRDAVAPPWTLWGLRANAAANIGVRAASTGHAHGAPAAL